MKTKTFLFSFDVLNFLLLIFLVQSAERREFQNIFFCSVPYHIQPWVVVGTWVFIIHTLPTCSNADFGSYVPSIVKWPIINNFRIVFLIRPFLSIYYKTDHRKIDIYRVMMPKIRLCNIFIFHDSA